MSFLSQPGIFNVLDSWASSGPMIANQKTLAAAQQNTACLQAATNAAQTATATACDPNRPVAAEILIPGHTVVPEPVNNPGSNPDNGSVYCWPFPQCTQRQY